MPAPFAMPGQGAEAVNSSNGFRLILPVGETRLIKWPASFGVQDEHLCLERS
jgi:hypothetical protein